MGKQMKSFVERSARHASKGRVSDAIACLQTAMTLVEGSPAFKKQQIELLHQRIRELGATHKARAYAPDTPLPADASVPLAVPATKSPGVKWSDVIGLKDVKEGLEVMIELPKRQPQLDAARTGGRSILFYGAPGTGKSLLAKAIATAVNGTYHEIKSTDVVSQWQGMSEQNIQRRLDAARDEERPVVFVDEIDSLARKRQEDEQDATRRIKTTLLIGIQGILENRNAIVVFATNCHWELDDAFLRRMTRTWHIPLPTRDDRLAWIEAALAKGRAAGLTHEVEAIDMALMADHTDMYSCSDLERWLRGAIDICNTEITRCTSFVRFDANGTYAVFQPGVDERDEAKTTLFTGMRYHELPDAEGKLLPHPLHLKHLEDARGQCPATITAEDLERYQ